MAPLTITIIGSVNMDLVTLTSRIPSGGETLTATSFATGPGGKGANQAVASSRLSRPKASSPSTNTHTPDITVKMIGAVGADSFGPTLIQSMKNDLIDTSGVKTVEGVSTGVAVILVESDSGENRILLNPGANYSLRPENFLTPESLGSPLPSLIILQLEIPLDTVLQILKTAKEAKVDVLLNPAPAVKLPDSMFPSIGHLIVNETEAAILTSRQVEEVEKEGFSWEGIGKEFLGKGVRNVVITLGGKGAYFAGKEGEGYVDAEKVERVVDTTAAGDTFVGAYAVNIVRGKGGITKEIVRLACKAAGRTVEKQGAQSAIPWADEVERVSKS